jgi:ribosomal protein S18 acetylase RimI-like enzyme
VLYRLYQPEDFSPLYAIEEACFEPPLRFSRSYMHRLVRSPRTAAWIAEQDGQMAGFAVVEWTREAAVTLAYIQTLEVAPNHRCLGVGGELLRHAEASARGAGADLIWLHVDAENTPAIHLYEAQGYRRQGREESYYARGKSALIYAKSLETEPLVLSIDSR